jgi:hypothetical protein
MTDPRLLPLRVQPGLHRPAADLRRGPAAAQGAGGDHLRRVDRRLVQPDCVPREARGHHSAAVGLRAQGRGLTRVWRRTSSPPG